jgi:hypothetical protein
VIGSSEDMLEIDFEDGKVKRMAINTVSVGKQP